MILAPCENLIPDDVNIDELCELYRDIGKEYNEVTEAWNDLTQEADNGKLRQHLRIGSSLQLCAADEINRHLNTRIAEMHRRSTGTLESRPRESAALRLQAFAFRRKHKGALIDHHKRTAV